MAISTPFIHMLFPFLYTLASFMNAETATSTPSPAKVQFTTNNQHWQILIIFKTNIDELLINESYHLSNSSWSPSLIIISSDSKLTSFPPFRFVSSCFRTSARVNTISFSDLWEVTPFFIFPLVPYFEFVKYDYGMRWGIIYTGWTSFVLAKEEVSSISTLFSHPFFWFSGVEINAAMVVISLIK